jgi:pilus assembly protein CpaC
MMTRTRLFSRLAFILLISVAGIAPVAARTGAAAGDETGTVKLLVGRSAVVNVNVPITRVSLTSADVADALVTTPNQLLIQGKVPGTISMFVWDRGGTMHRYDVTVERDLSPLVQQMREHFPGENITVASNGKAVVVSGTVSKKFIAEKAVEVAAGHVDKKEDVVNLLQVRETRPPQVLLRVRFAEVSRSALTELGASFFTSPLGVNDTIGRVSTSQFPSVGFERLEWTKEGNAFGDEVVESKGQFTFSDFLNVFLFNKQYDLGFIARVLQNRGLFQSLAEPNLVAESGKEASFLAGGEFPIPIAQGGSGSVAISVMFKEFGVRLNFTPTVSADNSRVRLKVRPEVSTLDFGNAIVLQGFRIPALSTRRTETELELDNGQTFAIAGLLNNSMTESLQKVPGIGDIPILGYLFRSKAAQKNRTELVVMITPEVLPSNSPGLTTETPRMQEPLLGPIPENRQLPMPGPAFTPQGDSPAMVPRPRGSSDAPAAAVPPSAAQEAADVLRARMPKAPTMMTPSQAPASPGAAAGANAAPAATSGDATTDAAGNAPAPPAAVDAAPAVSDAATAAPLSKEEAKRLKKARDEEQKAEERRRKEAEKAAKQARKDAEKAMKEVEKAAQRNKEQE